MKMAKRIFVLMLCSFLIMQDVIPAMAIENETTMETNETPSENDSNNLTQGVSPSPKEELNVNDANVSPSIVPSNETLISPSIEPPTIGDGNDVSGNNTPSNAPSDIPEQDDAPSKSIIQSIVNYDGSNAYASYQIKFKDKSSVMELLPSKIPVFINDEVEDIDVSWTPNNDYYDDTTLSFIFTSNINMDNYEIDENVVLPYVTFEVDKTITSFVDYSNGETIQTVTIDYDEKEKTFNEFPKTLNTYCNNGESIKKTVDIEWICTTNDYNTVNRTEYIFQAKLKDENQDIDSGIIMPYIKVNVTQTITAFTKYSGSGAFNSLRLFPSEQSSFVLEGRFADVISVYINGFERGEDDVVVIPANWLNDENIRTSSKTSFTLPLEIPSEYKVKDGLTVPYCEVIFTNNTFVIQNYLQENSKTEIYNSKNPYMEFNVDYNSKANAYLQFPTSIFVLTTTGDVVDIGIEWICDEDVVNTKKDSYVYVAHLLSEDYSFSQTLDMPWIKLNVDNSGVTSFVDYDGMNPYKTISVTYINKNTIASHLPSTIKVYFGNDTAATTVNVTWTPEYNPLSSDYNIYYYYVNLPDSCILSNSLENKYKNDKTALPYIKVIISDYYDMSADNVTFNYKGSVQTYKAPYTGKYYIEAYGGSGYGASSSANGLGGVTKGYYNLNKGDTLYIYTGGAGNGSTGGYNGGGNGSNGSGGGGGATHVAINTNRGLLNNYKSHLDEIVTIAAGGGGISASGNTFRSIGSGGGLIGQAPQDSSSGGQDRAVPGTQTSGYGFGVGQNGVSGGGAGGAGLYGGYSSGNSNWGGAGGSSYIAQQYNAITEAGLNLGDGYVKISYEGAVTSSLTIETNNAGTWNGKTGTILVGTNNAGQSIALPDPIGLSGFEFKGWEVVEGDGIVSGKTFIYGSTNTILKAKWYRALYLTSNINWGIFNKKGGVDLSWQEDDINQNNAYRVYYSTDKTNWQIIDEDGDTTTNPQAAAFSNVGVNKYTVTMTGYYYLEAYGAQGGYDGGIPGNGGYIKVKVYLKKGTVLYAYVGGKGADSYTNSPEIGGWNGGANAGEPGASGAGGGATDFRLNSSIASRIVAAGGGGGANNTSSADYGQHGGNGPSNGVLGYGSSPGGSDGGGGGGGWYGGTAGRDGGTRAGGGTNGYTTSYGGYNFQTTVISSIAGMREGNGYARITPYLMLPTITDSHIGASSPDTAAPNTPTNAYVTTTDGLNTWITWDIPTDNGVTYYHKVESINPDNGTLYETSNITENYIESGLSHYAYYIDGNATGTINANNLSSMTIVSTNELKMQKTTAKQYLHIVAVDKAGNISKVYNYEIPIIYYLRYNSNTSTDTSMSNTSYKDSRVFAFGTNYTYDENTFTKKGTGYYSQELNYNFIGWGFKPFSSYAKTNAIYPYLYKTNLVYKLTNFLTGNPAFVSNETKNNSQDRIYYTNKDTFKNLTNTNGSTIDIYAEWVADNQRPYCGFVLQTLIYNDDGTSTGELKNSPYDSYDINNYNDTTKTTTVYDDTPYFLYTQYRDPEGNTCNVEYQYSIDNGNTWYKLDSSVSSLHSQYLTVKNYKTSGGTLLGINFVANKKVLIRMRAKDTVKYPVGYTYNQNTKSYETYELQKSMWSTGYFVDTTHIDYDTSGKYLGDYGIKGNQGGSWYVKTINCYVGNESPLADLIADDLDISSLPENYTFEDIISLMEQQNFFNFPMYDYTTSGETWGYKDGTLYILISQDFETKAHCTNDMELVNQFFDANIDKFSYLKNTPVVLIKESDNYQYTTFTPEDESIAFLNASVDVDNSKHTSSPTSSIDMTDTHSYFYNGSVTSHNAFSHYWIAICEIGSTSNVLTTKRDIETSYTTENTSNGTLYTKTINGKKIAGLIYDSYEQMIEDVYNRSAALFATRSDVEINMYDVYFSVCDKSWNLVSPNKWGNVTKKTLIVEPRLTIYDVLFNDETETSSNYTNYVSLFKDGTKPYYHINKYTLLNGKYSNYDANFINGTNVISTLQTLNSNANSNYEVDNGVNSFVKNNGATPIKLGYYFDFMLRTHGAEISKVTVYDTNDELVETMTKSTFEGNYTNGIMSINETRKGTGSWYKNSNYMFAVPEQLFKDGYYLRIDISKTPYTNKESTLTRTIYIGDKDNPLFVPQSSMLEDVGVTISN